VLPSPLTFPTPVNVNGPSFARAEIEVPGEKRKGNEEQVGEPKRVKT
jgi:hypothetical protein